jgi:hypothetical protein
VASGLSPPWDSAPWSHFDLCILQFALCIGGRPASAIVASGLSPRWENCGLDHARPLHIDGRHAPSAAQNVRPRATPHFALIVHRCRSVTPAPTATNLKSAISNLESSWCPVGGSPHSPPRHPNRNGRRSLRRHQTRQERGHTTRHAKCYDPRSMTDSRSRHDTRSVTRNHTRHPTRNDCRYRQCYSTRNENRNCLRHGSRHGSRFEIRHWSGPRSRSGSHPLHRPDNPPP